ncbi:cAMP-binding domain of CRP or a regulatory subunit of cAMP-dependent protein kinases [Bacillus altitudinis]|uniref:Crp/Fnr family transcriptional regulator n=1 Tax=Bacillus altitudinis TaxID=293387 RepID=UPI00091DE3D1|nr:Crp/Fnr family transcriptional regulator [Bacillus altitudinis]SFW97534.1 cAMP-binding domain of CRP or a regulatory subunit of cAMP-dependent protein kinases [Bacillus altitudinis]SNR83239.1 cAMP-binding domain of CRP or a regulatory subunit of cAMP-dependent protein kinases [Bacillus altitudinis]
MEELHDESLFYSYIKTHQLQNVFHQKLISHVSLWRYQQGELICSKGDKREYMYLLVKGKLKIFTTTKEGKTFILCFKNPLEAIGDIEYVQQTDMVNTVEAVTEVHMLRISHQALMRHAKDDPRVLTFLLKGITNKFYTKSNDLSFHLLYPVEVRLASYLLSVLTGDDDARARPLRLTDAASLIGTSYRHINRVIQQFQEKGLIERRRGKITICDQKGLLEIAEHNIYE